MGCLVAKCSLTNTLLNEGDTAYLNLIIESQNEMIGFNTKCGLISGDKKIDLPYTYGGSSLSSSCQYFKPIGIILKCEYKGWSSFEIDDKDERTINNLVSLVDYLKYSYESNGEIEFNVNDVTKLIDEGEYSSAWEIIDEAMRISGSEKVYIENSLGSHSKLYYNVISSFAFEKLLDENLQKKVYSDFIYGLDEKDVKTYQERIEHIPIYLERVNDKQKDYYDNLCKNKSYGLNDEQLNNLVNEQKIFGLTRMLFDFTHDIDKSDFIISQKKVMDDKIFHDRIFKNKHSENLNKILADLVFQHYVNLVYHYFDIAYLPITNVNFEEYQSTRTILFNKFQSEVILSDDNYEDTKFESCEKLVPKEQKDNFFIVAYQNDYADNYFFEHIEKNYSKEYEIIGVQGDKEMLCYDHKNNVVFYEYYDTIIDEFDIVLYATG